MLTNADALKDDVKTFAYCGTLYLLTDLAAKYDPVIQSIFYRFIRAKSRPA